MIEGVHLPHTHTLISSVENAPDLYFAANSMADGGRVVSCVVGCMSITDFAPVPAAARTRAHCSFDLSTFLADSMWNSHSLVMKFCIFGLWSVTPVSIFAADLGKSSTCAIAARASPSS